MTPSRAAAVAAFLAENGLGDALRTPLAGDASARRYERLRRSDGSTLILVDTPNPADDLAPFVAVGRLLAAVGLSVPAVFAADVGSGLALQEDFGDDAFAALLDRGAPPGPLYALAADALIALHRRFRPEGAADAGLPVYDAALFTEQALLFADIALPPAIGRAPTAGERDGFAQAWRAVLEPACAGPRTLLLRDYHVGNLMRLPRDGVRAAGLIDFQNAGLGPAAYDLVSLLEDARRDVPADLAAAVLARHHAAFPERDRADFDRSAAVLAAVRHARVIAVFLRLAARDGKRGYLAHLPRVWRMLDERLALPALAPVAAWFARVLPPERRLPLIVPRME